MTMGKLLWGMTWRAVVWNIILGIALAILIILFALILTVIVPEAPQATPSIGEPEFAILIVGMALPLLGIFEGFWVGFFSGIFLAILSRMFFFPLKNAQRFFEVARMSNALFGAVVFVIATSMLSTEVSTDFFIAAIIVGCGIWLITLPIVNWYERESTKGITQNVSSN